MKKKNKSDDCCQKRDEKKYQPLWMGVIYGLIPHLGCISFLVFAIFGSTVALTFLAPILSKPYFFPLLILLSFLFATASALIYLKNKERLTFWGIISEKNYLFALYFGTILINIFLLFVIFPFATNVAASKMAAERVSSQDLQQVLPLMWISLVLATPRLLLKSFIKPPESPE